MQFDEAREVLSELILERAAKTEADLGFGWVATPDAPSAYRALLQAFRHSELTGSPLPVSSENSGSVVYTSTDVNMAMRYWHDVNHVRLGLTFNSVDELALGLWHLAELGRAGWPPESAVGRLLEIDLLGQNYLWAVARRFATDQLQFTRYCFEHGLHQGVLNEAKN